MKKFYLIAGEASGDLHGSHLVRELKKLDPEVEIRCWGGEKMEEAGATLVKHYRELAFMGFAEVVKNLPVIFRNLSFCKKDILAFSPDVVVLIDYPGFNMRIAKWAKSQGIKTAYYISPKVWAWKENRVKAMKKYIDRLIIIFPFEKDYFKNKWNWDVDYVGNPLADIIKKWKREAASRESKRFSNKPIIALLPGSRKQEILKKLPVMLETSKAFPAHDFIIAKSPGLDESFYDELIRDYPQVSYVTNKTYELLFQSEAALVTSGTATLETALLGIPQIVCYKTSWLSYQVGKRVIKVKFISLVNLIMNREVVRELIQFEMNPANLEKELLSILKGTEKRQCILEDYEILGQLLAPGKKASEKAAAIIYEHAGHSK